MEAEMTNLRDLIERDSAIAINHVISQNGTYPTIIGHSAGASFIIQAPCHEDEEFSDGFLHIAASNLVINDVNSYTAFFSAFYKAPHEKELTHGIVIVTISENDRVSRLYHAVKIDDTIVDFVLDGENCNIDTDRAIMNLLIPSNERAEFIEPSREFIAMNPSWAQIVQPIKSTMN